MNQKKEETCEHPVGGNAVVTEIPTEVLENLIWLNECKSTGLLHQLLRNTKGTPLKQAEKQCLRSGVKLGSPGSYSGGTSQSPFSFLLQPSSLMGWSKVDPICIVHDTAFGRFDSIKWYHSRDCCATNVLFVMLTSSNSWILKTNQRGTFLT